MPHPTKKNYWRHNKLIENIRQEQDTIQKNETKNQIELPEMKNVCNETKCSVDRLIADQAPRETDFTNRKIDLRAA